MELQIPPEVVHIILDKLKDSIIEKVELKFWSSFHIGEEDGLIFSQRLNRWTFSYRKDRVIECIKTMKELRNVSKCFATAFDSMWICVNIGGQFGRQHNYDVAKFSSWLSYSYLEQSYLKQYVDRFSKVCAFYIFYMIVNADKLIYYKILGKLRLAGSKIFNKIIHSFNIEDGTQVIYVLNTVISKLIKNFKLHVNGNGNSEKIVKLVLLNISASTDITNMGLMIKIMGHIKIHLWCCARF